MPTERLVTVAATVACAAGLAWGESAPQITNLTRTVSGNTQIAASASPGAGCRLQSTDDLQRAFTNIDGTARVAAGDGSVAWTVPAGEASPAYYRMRQSSLTGKTLITWAELEGAFAGTFAVPMAEDGDDRFGYSSGVHAQLTNGNLLVVGHPYQDNQAQVQLPTVLDGREGTRVGDWIDITQGLHPDGWDGPPAYYVGGMLEVGNRIHFTKYQWYNGSGTNWQTQGYYDGGYDGSGTASGMWTVDNPYAHHSRVGGYVSYPPTAIRTNGYVYLAGLQGTSGAATGRWGPNLFAVDPTPSNGTVRAATVMCHDTEAHQAPDVAASNATSAWWVANSPTHERWWIANKATDVEWIETDTHHGILYFVYRGIGHTWYGLHDAGPGHPDPYGGTSGFHAEGWALQAWIYDPEDVMAAYRGERDPWSLAPAEAVLLTERLPGSTTETHYSFFTGPARTDLTMSLRDRRLVVLQEDGHPADEDENTPKGYVFNLP
jgi:hypothetical protein